MSFGAARRWSGANNISHDMCAEADYGSVNTPWPVHIPIDGPEDSLLATANARVATLDSRGAIDHIDVVIVDDTVAPPATLIPYLMKSLGHDRSSIASEGLDG